MVRQWELIGALIAIWVFCVVTNLAVEGLDEVSHVVDEKTKRVRLCNIFIVWELIHKMKVDVGCLIVITALAREPVYDAIQTNCQVAVALTDVIVLL